ncbi:MAG: RHS repeat-associated core domain-containing protein [Kiritimatiellae bacterium]|nr:RHS repeat-associated core domain-containing protein [Kiritimatiellia bacterium]
MQRNKFIGTVPIISCWILLLAQNIKAMQVKYEYDRYGRVGSVISVNLVNETNTFHYSYLTGTDLVSGYTNCAGLKVEKGFERHRDCVSSISNTWDGNLINAFTYANDAVKKRVSRKDYNASGLQSNNTFSYNIRGEISGSNVSGINFTYSYDAIGNRVSSACDNVTNLYTANSLNQCVSEGTPQTQISRIFDDDGNITHDNTWHYQWDANNRLHTMHALVETNDAIHIQNRYDSEGRKKIKAIFRLRGRGPDYPADQTQEGNWDLCKIHEYSWDDMNMVLEKITNYETSSTTIKTYTWGLDLSGSLHNAGGIGGLLMVSELKGSTSQNYFPVADANGNITDYLDETGNIVAHYEYSPFGELLQKSGVKADDFTHRFSSKPYCSITHLVEYQYRYYDPRLGIFINRDPFEEKGSTGLYRFVNNDPINFVDILGLYTLSDAEKALAKAGVKRLGSKYIMTGPYSSAIKQEFYTDTQVFDQWVQLEKKQENWWTKLPKCPKELHCNSKTGKPANPNSSIWTDPQKLNYISSRLYHPGGAYEMRTKASGNGNQCIYNKNLKVMRNIPAAGSADWVNPTHNRQDHYLHDVDTYNSAKRLNRINDYYQFRPIWTE